MVRRRAAEPRRPAASPASPRGEGALRRRAARAPALREGGPGPAVQFWFDYASTYSYVAALRVEDAARAAGVALEWRPFLLGPVFTEQLGIKDSPFNVFPVRGRYTLLTRASSPQTKQALRDRGAEAARLGIFGAPDLVVDGELFFGQDRLDDALAWATRAR